MGDLTELEYDAADRLYELLDARPDDWFSPSAAGRQTHDDTTTAKRVLAWMFEHRLVDADGNGAWRKYAHRRIRGAGGL